MSWWKFKELMELHHPDILAKVHIVGNDPFPAALQKIADEVGFRLVPSERIEKVLADLYYFI